MSIERKEEIIVVPEGNNGIINVITNLTERRSTLHHKDSDGIREKDNQIYVNLGATGLTGGVFEVAAVQGLNIIIDGFNHTNVSEMAQGAGIVGLASAFIPVSWHFLNEAKLKIRERKKIEAHQRETLKRVS